MSQRSVDRTMLVTVRYYDDRVLAAAHHVLDGHGRDPSQRGFGNRALQGTATATHLASTALLPHGTPQQLFQHAGLLLLHPGRHVGQIARVL